MRVVHGFHGLGLDLDQPAVTIGNFDGVHRGHQRVMRAAVEAADYRSAMSVVCTFEPHTLQVLRPEDAPDLLQTLDQKLRAIATLGVDMAVVIPFDEAVAATGRRHFVDDFLCGELSLGSLHVSKGFSFGRGRSGETQYLEERAAETGFGVTRVEASLVAGEPTSSSRIRSAVVDGEVELARRLLGRPYALSGEVITGSGRGRGLGAPTANMVPTNGCLPATGVYSGLVDHEGSRLPALMNIGRRPTFGEGGDLHFEAHLLDFDGDLYGATLEFELIARVRDERRFPTPDALAAQIDADVVLARSQLLAASG